MPRLGWPRRVKSSLPIVRPDASLALPPTHVVLICGNAAEAAQLLHMQAAPYLRTLGAVTSSASGAKWRLANGALLEITHARGELPTLLRTVRGGVVLPLYHHDTTLPYSIGSRLDEALSTWAAAGIIRLIGGLGEVALLAAPQVVDAL